MSGTKIKRRESISFPVDVKTVKRRNVGDGKVFKRDKNVINLPIQTGDPVRWAYMVCVGFPLLVKELLFPCLRFYSQKDTYKSTLILYYEQTPNK